MKKQLSPAKQARRQPGAGFAKSARGKRARAGSKTKPGLSARTPEANAIAASAKRLLGKVNETHRRADTLHRGIEKAHRTAAKVHNEVRQAALPEVEEQDVQIVEEHAGPRKPFPIVGIGASAGGFEAFTEFLKHLPANTGMAFVLVQHLDPKHRSLLSELLSRSSSLPVREIVDGIEVKPDHIYVIPENASISLSGGRLRISPRHANESPPMPIDTFLRTLAREQQERAIGIVLSGTGTDGSLGIAAIKGEGGITLAQHESSAKYFGMPGSAISSGTVDYVLSPRDMALELTRIAGHPSLGRDGKRDPKAGRDRRAKGEMGDNDADMRQIFGLLRGRSGVDFSLYKHSTLQRRIARQMILKQKDSLGEYADFLSGHAEELDNLFNDLLINVTSFFRDDKAFTLLKKRIFPRVVKSHDVESPLRFWVCGCATGEEAYSLAICLVEFFDQVRQHRPVQIFASDITEPGIARARTGIYPENIVQDVSPERLRRFFTKTDGRYQVSKSIREMVIFARQNVAMDPPFSNLDLITCRNVLIYLGPILQRKVLPLFHHALRPTGYLMLGSSETVGGSADLFRIVDKKHRIYSKKHSTRPMIYEPSRKFKPHVETPASARSRPRLSGEAPEADLPGYVDKLLLREFSPAAVVVNSELEVLQFRGRTSDFLEHPSGTATLNVLRMAREGIALDLRAAISKALKQKVPVKQSSHLRREGQLREFTIEIIPFQPSTDAEHFLLIIFKETGRVTQVETSRDNKGRAVVRDARELDRTRAELVSTRDTLQTIIEEQESNNEELRCANEEIQSSNEELQSTNEELETAKEELQSTNEELTTLNEELQTRNQELGVVLDDLTNLLASAHMAIIILDANLNIRRCTPLAERMFNMIPADIGRRLSDLNRPLIVPDLDDSIHKVINTLVPIERDVQDREGRWYSLRIRPYRTRENHIAGAVLVLIDIDQLKRALELLLNTAKEPLLTLGPDLTVRKANESFYKTFRLKPEQTEGRQIHEVGDGQWDQLKFHELLENVLPKDKQVHDFPMESTFPEIGRRKLLVNARRFYDEGWGVQIILLAIEDVTDKPEPQA